MKMILLVVTFLTGCANTYLNQPNPISTTRVVDGATVMTLKKYDGYYIGVTEGNLITGGDWPPAHIRKEKIVKAVEAHSNCRVVAAEFDPALIANVSVKIDCANK